MIAMAILIELMNGNLLFGVMTEATAILLVGIGLIAAAMLLRWLLGKSSVSEIDALRQETIKR
jgi:hypothetical protein